MPKKEKSSKKTKTDRNWAISIGFHKSNSMLDMEDFIADELNKAKILVTQKAFEYIDDIPQQTKIIDKKTKLRPI